MNPQPTLSHCGLVTNITPTRSKAVSPLQVSHETDANPQQEQSTTSDKLRIGHEHHTNPQTAGSFTAGWTRTDNRPATQPNPHCGSVTDITPTRSKAVSSLRVCNGSATEPQLTHAIAINRGERHRHGNHHQEPPSGKTGVARSTIQTPHAGTTPYSVLLPYCSSRATIRTSPGKHHCGRSSPAKKRESRHLPSGGPPRPTLSASGPIDVGPESGAAIPRW
ncbi:hypothetical protein BTIS_1846 [Bifidobacterium tissieri]|uniref:Uncharacterized protein n=1 Tax=Bifidobacterium tissieri TaxID=1630162 RepID=A0A261FBV6_9BIFI|nr:hypothetical protein BTIS_1846 [Bifidobacterium tissieri]